MASKTGWSFSIHNVSRRCHALTRVRMSVVVKLCRVPEMLNVVIGLGRSAAMSWNDKTGPSSEDQNLSEKQRILGKFDAARSQMVFHENSPSSRMHSDSDWSDGDIIPLRRKSCNSSGSPVMVRFWGEEWWMARRGKGSVEGKNLRSKSSVRSEVRGSGGSGNLTELSRRTASSGCTMYKLRKVLKDLMVKGRSGEVVPQ